MSSSEVDGKYAWVIVLAVFWNNAHNWGILSSYGVFLAYFTSHSTFPGSRTLDYAFIGGLCTSQALAISPIVTILHRRFGLKGTMALGIVLETTAFLGASWSKEIWQLYLSQGVCLGWGLGLQYLSTTYLIPQWFSHKRSLAAGIATGGTGTGGLIYSLASHSMITHFGIPWSYRILGIVQLVVNSICLLIIRDRKPLDYSTTRSLKIKFSLGTRYEMWLFMGWSFLSVMGFMVIWFSLATYGRSVGLTSAQGSIVTAVMNIGQMFGRPAVGFMSDYIGRINMATIATLFSGLLCLLLWVFARTYASLICFSLFAGMLFGTFWTVVGPLAAEVVGLSDLQSCLTIIWFVCAIPATFGEAIGLELRTSGYHEFLGTQLFTGFMYIGASICLILLRSWKISQTDETERDSLSTIPRYEMGASPEGTHSTPDRIGKFQHIVRMGKV